MVDKTAEIRRQVEERVAEETTEALENESEITTDFVLACLNANETGDGILYARLMHENFLYTATQDRWLKWDGHHWIFDKLMESEEAVERVAEIYLKTADDMKSKCKDEGHEIHAPIGKNDPEEVVFYKSQYKRLAQRVQNVRTTSRATKILRKALVNRQIPIAIRGEEIDQKPWLLPVANGVINLKTGEMHPGRREDFLLKSAPVEWQGIDAPCEQWEKALLEIFEGSEALVKFLQRLLGFALIGELRQAVFAVMTGKGRNGKSMITEIVCKVMGPLAGPIRAEMLLDQFRSNSAGPSADIMYLWGMRAVFASEPDENTRISSNRVKWITGEPRLTGRYPHDKEETSFNTSHTTFLLANEIPRCPPEDFAFWERTFVIPFGLSFVDRDPTGPNEVRADPDLPRKLEKELPGILAWMVRGCLEYQQIGLNPPPIVLQATSDKRRDDDVVQDFIDYCCLIKPEERIGATQLYNAFTAWWKKFVGKKPYSQKKFGNIMRKKGFESEKVCTVFYLGITLNEGITNELFPDETAY